VDGFQTEPCDFRDGLASTTATALFPCNAGSQPSLWGRALDDDFGLADNDEQEE
jgi:hypothetical protein